MPSVVRVFLLGDRHSGKTSTASCILANDGQEADNHNLMRGTVILDETKVEVMDTPGWTTESPYTAEFRRQLLHDWVSGSASGICILLLLVNASSSFTLRKAAEDHLRVLGGKAWSSTVVLFTHGDWLGDVSVEQYIESEGDPLQTLVEKCGNRYQVFNNKIKDNGTQVTELMQKLEEMVLEQILNNAKNRGNIQRPLVNDEFRFGGRVQIGEMQKTPLRISTNLHHGEWLHFYHKFASFYYGSLFPPCKIISQNVYFINSKFGVYVLQSWVTTLHFFPQASEGNVNSCLYSRGHSFLKIVL